MGKQIWLIDDDEEISLLVKNWVEGWGDSLETFSHPAVALDALQAVATTDKCPDVILCDLRLPGMGGLDLLPRLLEVAPETPCVFVTAHASLDSAVAAVRGGAADYLEKPLDPNTLRLAIERASRLKVLARENVRLNREVQGARATGRILTKNPAMKSICDLVEKAAATPTTVLLQGESGTGKEVLARTLHELSDRKDKPFVAINCAAIPPELLESELFGHSRGAFTGAVNKKKGLFEHAQGGTLFLDEVGDMPLLLQAKLLRVLQERVIRPVGENSDVPIDVRVVAATHRDLRVEVESGRFREDLYYRLNVLPIRIPPLRDRREDIPLLAEHFLGRFARRYGRELKGFTPHAVGKLMRNGWQGNVRELENWVERAVVLAEGEFIEDFPFCDSLSPQNGAMSVESVDSKGQIRLPDDLTLQELEDLYIHHILKLCGGVKERAARVLGVDRKTLYRREKAALMTHSA